PGSEGGPAAGVTAEIAEAIARPPGTPARAAGRIGAAAGNFMDPPAGARGAATPRAAAWDAAGMTAASMGSSSGDSAGSASFAPASGWGTVLVYAVDPTGDWAATPPTAASGGACE